MKTPTPFEVQQYALSLGFVLDGNYFCDYYEMRGWMVGRVPMKNWQAAVRTWKYKANPEFLIHPKPTVDPEKIEQKKNELRELAEREFERKQAQKQIKIV